MVFWSELMLLLLTIFLCHGTKGDFLDSAAAVAVLNCTFETQCPDIDYDKGDEFTYGWDRTNKATSSRNTGPDDETGNRRTGYFLYSEAGKDYKYRSAKIWTVSPIDGWEGNGCLHFKYHMYGKDIGKLVAQIINHNNTANFYLNESINGDQGNAWKNFFQTFRAHQDTPFELNIKAYHQNSPYGDILIDDIFIFKMNCQDLRCSPWSPWTKCTATCGEGIKVRTRPCEEPSRNKIHHEVQPCVSKRCNDPVVWSEWENWVCSVTCGTGQRTRSRRCLSKSCGTENESQTEPYAVVWSEWENWVCSVTCGKGQRTRSRRCLSGSCGTDQTQSEPCYLQLCPAESECKSKVVVMTGLTGTITSPGYKNGQNYGNSMNCRWRISAPRSQMHILLTVQSFETQLHYDFLGVYDGYNTSQPSITSMHGNVERGVQYRSSGQYMFLDFASDSTTTKRGFSVTFQAIEGTTCPNRVISLNQLSGFITSPGYLSGHYYHNNADCHWSITAPSRNMTIVLTVQSFRTEKMVDYLDIYDGKNVKAPGIYSLHGRVNPGKQFRSTGRHMYIQFWSSKAGRERGFYLTYRAVAESECKSKVVVMTGLTGTITSPGYKNGQNYGNSMNCRWRISAPRSQMHILLTVQSFETQLHYDFLGVYDGYNTSQPSITSMHGNVERGVQYRSSGQYMYLDFASDSTTTKMVFSVTYQAIEGTTCPNRVISLNQLSGFITSPGYLSGHYYHNNADCHWSITAPSRNMTIVLTVQSFRTENMVDYLDIYDGNSVKAPGIYSLHGRVNPGKQFRSTGRHMYIQFWSSKAGRERGFYLTYRAVGKKNIFIIQ